MPQRSSLFPALILAAALFGGCALILPREHTREGSRVDLRLPTAEGESSFRWIQESGPAVEIQEAEAPEAWFIAPQSRENYRMVFARLSERKGKALSRSFGVYVIAENDPPLSRAGATIFTGEGERVELPGEGVDPEGSELVYSWRQAAGPRVTLAGAGGSRAEFQAPQVVARTYLRFELAVSDGSNPAVVDEVTVVVDPVDSVPTLFVEADVTVREREQVHLEARGVDPEGAELVYVWSLRTGSPALALAEETGPTPSFTAPACPADVDSYTLTFDVTASDGANVSQTERVVVTVVADEGVPVAEAGEDLRVKEGERVRLMGRASHPEGRDLTYEWRQASGPVELQLEEANTLTPLFVAPEVPEGKRAIEAVLVLTVTDGEHRSRDLVAVQIEPTFAPRLKRTALPPGEIDRLLVAEAGFLPRWIRARLSPANAGTGFFATGEELLEARFSRASGSLSCDLPPGTWRLEGKLALNAIDHRADLTPGAGRGALLRFETAEGEACAFGLMTLGQRLGVQLRRMDRDLYTGDWLVTEEPLRVLSEVETREEVCFRATWRELRLSFRWASEERALEEAPEHVVDLARSPELLSLQIDRARAIFSELRLTGGAD